MNRTLTALAIAILVCSSVLSAAPGASSVAYTATLSVPRSVHPGFRHSVFSAPTNVTEIFGTGIKSPEAVTVASVALEVIGSSGGLNRLRAVRVFLSRDNGDRMVRIASRETLPAGANVVPFQELEKKLYLDDVVGGRTVALRVEYVLDAPIESELRFRCVIGLSAQTEKKLPVSGRTLSIGGREAFVILPLQKSKGPTPWVWYAPTVSRLPAAEEQWMFERFQRAGLAVAGIDVGETYGNSEARALYSAFYNELTQHHGFATKPVLLARSRGGLFLGNWAADHPDKVAGVVGICAVADMQSNELLFARCCAAHGLTETEMRGQLDRCNPVDRLTPLAEASVPILLFQGDRDERVPIDRNAQEVEKRYRQLGGQIKVLVAAGQGHTVWPGYFQNQEVTDFIVTHAIEGMKRSKQAL